MSHADKHDVKNIFAGKSFFFLFILYNTSLFFNFSIFQFLYFSIIFMYAVL